MSARHIAILGCGVIGLSTAIAILEDEHAGAASTCVTVVAKEYPRPPEALQKAAPNSYARSSGSEPSAEFASVWAGAHHVSDAKNQQELRHDKVTFARMAKLAQDRPWKTTSSLDTPSASASTSDLNKSTGDRQVRAEALVWVHQTELFEAESNARGQPPYEDVLDWYPDFSPIPSGALPAGFGAGCTFSTLDINVPVYHHWLFLRFTELGGRLVVQEVASLSEAIHASTSTRAKVTGKLGATVPNHVDALIVSPGLGARSLNDLKDEAVHPHRGQVVVVHAPWLTVPRKPGNVTPPKYTLPGVSIVRAQGGRETYIIPRGDGTVICGGTRLVDDWDTCPRPETTKQILTRCLNLVPELVDPRKRTLVTVPTIDDLDVVSVNVGLRPARKGGVRLEHGNDIDGVKVIYNYGYGGWGYQASWGAALDARKLLIEALSSSSTSAFKL